MIEHYKNQSLDNIFEVVDGITYAEEWKDIVGFEGAYKVSNFGRVKRLEKIDNINHKWQEIILKSFTSYGYRRIALTVNKKQVKFQVHRVVATAFIPNKKKLSDVNHKRGVRYDNRSFMLEWCSSSDNHKHAYRELGKTPNANCRGRFGKLHHNSIPVIKVSLDGFIIEEYESKTEAAIKNKTAIYNIWSYIKKGIPFNGYYFK